MLDGEHVIVAEHSERGGKLLPPFRAMAVAAGAEDPSTVALIRVWLGVEYSCQRQISWVQLRVFGMHVEDGIAENPDGGDWIDALPEHVAWVVVAANRQPG